MKLNNRQEQIVNIVFSNNGIGISEIKKALKLDISIPTLNRELKFLTDNEVFFKSGQARNIVYQVNPVWKYLNADIGDSYFKKDVDERVGNKIFDHNILSVLASNTIFSKEEKIELDRLQSIYLNKIEKVTPAILKKQQERLSIELSWKSSQIEGNTYSLLETEILLLQKLEAADKTKEEAIMLLNHKVAMDYIFEQRIGFTPLKVANIENIHAVLTKELNVNRNIRKLTVGITGTTYSPPGNEFQIREYLEKACEIINIKESVFEKALLSILLISCIQPFEDGNKRTARITANGILIENGFSALSYRGVQPIDYKKAIVLFYEQYNTVAFKKLFIEQYGFAVENYY